MIKEIIADILFIIFFIGLFGATAFIEPINQTVIEARTNDKN